MKKIANLLLVLLLLIVCFGCSNGNNSTQNASNNSNQINGGVVIDNTGNSTNSTVEEKAPIEKKEPVLTTVYEDSNCLIQFYMVDISGSRPEALYRVKNYTQDRTLTFQSDALSFNGESVQDFTLSDEVAANSSGTISARLSIEDESYFDFNNIASVSGQFTIIDFSGKEFENGKRSYEITFSNVEIPEVSYTPLVVDEGQDLYIDDNVKVSFLKAFEKNGRNYIELRCENKTDECLTFQCEAISLNGETAGNVTFSDSVAPHSKGNISIMCKIDTTFVDLSNIETVKGKLTVIAFGNSKFFNGKRSYNISF